MHSPTMAHRTPVDPHDGINDTHRDGAAEAVREYQRMLRAEQHRRNLEWRDEVQSRRAADEARSH